MPRTRSAGLPGFIPFQQLKLVAAPPTGDGWVHEIKFDGYRMQLQVTGGRAAWFSRNGNEWTSRLTDLGEFAAGLPDCILDGELCALGSEGQPDFSALRSIMGRRQAGAITGQLTYFVFDLLWLNGEDLRKLPLRDRMHHLQHEVMGCVDDVAFRLVEALPGEGKALLQAACGLSLEGIVSKRLDASYRSGERLDVWRKSKCRPGQEVVIGGWRTEGSRFQSIMAGVWEEGRFRYVGQVGTGLGRDAVEDLLPKLRALETERSPFQSGAPPRPREGLHWAKPELVANIEFAEWTGAGQVRQASYKGLREDKEAGAVIPERLP